MTSFLNPQQGVGDAHLSCLSSFAHIFIMFSRKKIERRVGVPCFLECPLPLPGSCAWDAMS